MAGCGWRRGRGGFSTKMSGDGISFSGSDWACRRLDKLLLPKRRLISRTHTKLHADLDAIRGLMGICFLFPPFFPFRFFFRLISSFIFVIE